jgi:hypothetical protein
MELKIQANLSIVHQCACGWIFLNVGFRLRSSNYAATSQSDNQHRLGNQPRPIFSKRLTRYIRINQGRNLIIGTGFFP